MPATQLCQPAQLGPSQQELGCNDACYYYSPYPEWRALHRTIFAPEGYNLPSLVAFLRDFDHNPVIVQSTIISLKTWIATLGYFAPCQIDPDLRARREKPQKSYRKPDGLALTRDSETYLSGRRKGRGSKRTFIELIFPPSSTWHQMDAKTVAAGLVRAVSWKMQTSLSPSVKIFLIPNFGKCKLKLYFRYASALSNELRGDTYDMLSFR